VHLFSIGRDAQLDGGRRIGVVLVDVGELVARLQIVLREGNKVSKVPVIRLGVSYHQRRVGVVLVGVGELVARLQIVLREGNDVLRVRINPVC